MNSLLFTDFYKIHHNRMYPDNMVKLYSNFTPRKSRIDGVNGVVVFGIQHFILQYLIKNFNENFFKTSARKHLEIIKEIRKRHGIDNEQFNKAKLDELKAPIIEEYKRHCPVDTKHIEDLWDLGYLPLEIKALPEGTICPIRVPLLTITNTHPKFAWLVNYLETLLSCMLWQIITSATIANEYRKTLNGYAKETTGSTEGVQWQGHDFAMRGLSSLESAILSGMGHLLSFTGTDTIPAIYQLEKSYNATGLIGASVPATEHSVMCMGTQQDELGTFRRLLKLYPEGILSVVSDTWNLWDVITLYLPFLKDEILARNGKLVIRPDSGDPVDIICGHELFGKDADQPNAIAIQKGVIELLWDIFGGTVNEQGYKVLDPHIGAIYGDSITIDRAKAICERLKAKGFASTNIIFGIGSYTYQMNTRDTFGFAMKATYGEILHEASESDEQNTIEDREIFKDPITDDGTKKSLKGLISLQSTKKGIQAFDQQTWKQEKQGLLETVFLNGELVKFQTLEEIRERLKNN